MAKVYQVVNGAAAGIAAPVAGPTGTAIRTMIQFSTSAAREARVVEWWWEGDGTTAATPAKVELVRHGATPNTTMTAYVAADVMAYEPNAVAPAITLGASNSGYSGGTPPTEVTPTTITGSIAHNVPPTSGIYIQYPLGREPEVKISTFLRLRNTVTPSVNVYCGLAWEE